MTHAHTRVGVSTKVRCLCGCAHEWVVSLTVSATQVLHNVRPVQDDGLHQGHLHVRVRARVRVRVRVLGLGLGSGLGLGLGLGF